jgi:PAS domain S-box-containing protein
MNDFSKMRNMKNKLSSKVLFQILETHGWKQLELAKRAGIVHSTVSDHLTHQRAIRDEHLRGYLSALDRTERQILLAAWMRDTLGADVITDVLDVMTNRLREEVTSWSPGLNLEQERMLVWWKDQLARDPELAELFHRITLKSGYPNPYEKLTIAVIITDAAGLTTYANPVFTKMCGYSLAQLRGRKPGQLLQGPETERAIIDEFSDAIAQRRYLECTMTNYDASRKLYRAHIKMYPVFDPLGTLIQFRAIAEKLA